MRVTTSVFDSRSEREVFTALRWGWSKKWALYPQLPLSKLIELEPDDRLRLTPGEEHYFYTANVDYTFCQATKPVLTVEFDGIGGGFSRNGVYVPLRETDDPHRELKMGFKVRTAKAAGYPLFVVSFDEVVPVACDTSITILDSLIGGFLARRDFESRFREKIVEAKAELDAMNREDARLRVESIGIEAELDAAWENDPLVRAAWEEVEKYADAWGGGNFGWKWLDGPPVAGREEVAGRLMAPGPSDADCVGCEMRVGLPDGEVVERAWIRNVGGDVAGVAPWKNAENLARYVAFKKANELLGQRG